MFLKKIICNIQHGSDIEITNTPERMNYARVYINIYKRIM